MSAGTVVFIVLAMIVAAAIVYLVITYNVLVSLRNQIRNAWSQIDVQLKRRHDLIPNLVQTVQGYTTHERQTLEAVTEARARAQGRDRSRRSPGPRRPERGARPAPGGGGELPPTSRRTRTSCTPGGAHLHGKPDRVRQAGLQRPGPVHEQQGRDVPSNIVAGCSGFRKGEFFELNEESERTVPRVSFS